MKALSLGIALILATVASAQTKTTQALHEKHSEALSAYFYHNTLRMLNQKEDKDFDALIKDIEKMKFLMIEKQENKFGNKDYQALTKGYKSEDYEEMMTSRHQGRNFDVYMREKDGKVKGTVVLVNDSSYVYILDILGSVAMDKATSLFSLIDESADIGEKIKNFTSKGDKARRRDKDDDDH